MTCAGAAFNVTPMSLTLKGDIKTMSGNQNVRTAGDAGWHVSKYNLYARIPGSEKFAVVNLIRGEYVRHIVLLNYACLMRPKLYQKIILLLNVLQSLVSSQIMMKQKH